MLSGAGLILVTVARLVALVGLWLVTLTALAGPQQDAPATPPKQVDTFFAGSVLEITPEKISVTRKVSGKTENRTFRITPETKVEGKLRTKVRVTVRYSSDDTGDTATLIVVRPAQTKK